jgi:DNA-binding HxlR family transcriptional regulator
MRGYGQFCPMALAVEIFGERWTLLILRELLLGSSRFNDIHRGVPRISPTLLAQRLRTLEAAGIVEHCDAGGYGLTEAGAELWPAIEALALWGKTWLPATLSEGQADPDLIIWDLHRRMYLERLPEGRTTIHFAFTDQPKAKRDRWILCSRDGAEFCITDPGFEADLYVTTDSRTITWVWYGDIPLKTALDNGLIVLDGPARLCDAFPSWLRLNLLAQVPRRHPLRRDQSAAARS